MSRLAAIAACRKQRKPAITAPHRIVFANEKGGTGKSTTAVHIAVALAYQGARVAALDLDPRQRTLYRYFENRAETQARRGVELPGATFVVFDGEGIDKDVLTYRNGKNSAGQSAYIVIEGFTAGGSVTIAGSLQSYQFADGSTLTAQEVQDRADAASKPAKSIELPVIPITGTAGDDVVVNTDAPQKTSTDDGNDIIVAGTFDDQILAGLGNDRLAGGGGKNLLVGKST